MQDLQKLLNKNKTPQNQIISNTTKENSQNLRDVDQSKNQHNNIQSSQSQNSKISPQAGQQELKQKLFQSLEKHAGIKLINDSQQMRFHEVGHQQKQQYDELLELKNQLNSMINKTEVQQAMKIFNSDQSDQQKELNNQDTQAGNMLFKKLGTQIGKKVQKEISDDLKQVYQKLKNLECDILDTQNFENPKKQQELKNSQQILANMLNEERTKVKAQIFQLMQGKFRIMQTETLITTPKTIQQDFNKNPLKQHLILTQREYGQQLIMNGDVFKSKFIADQANIKIYENLKRLENVDHIETKYQSITNINHKNQEQSYQNQNKSDLKLIATNDNVFSTASSSRTNLERLFLNPVLIKADLKSSVHVDISYPRAQQFTFENVLDRYYLEAKQISKSKQNKIGSQNNFTQNLENNFDLIGSHKNKDEERLKSRSPNESGIFADYQENSGSHHLLRQRQIRDFTSIDRRNIKTQKNNQQILKQGFKIYGSGGGIYETLTNRGSKQLIEFQVRENQSLVQAKYAPPKFEASNKKYQHQWFKRDPYDLKYISTIKEFEITDEDVELNSTQKSAFLHHYNTMDNNLDTSQLSRAGDTLTPRGMMNNNLMTVHDTFEEDSGSFRDAQNPMSKGDREKDINSYTDKVSIGGSPNLIASNRDSNQVQSIKFYEELLEYERYDHDLIDELFNPKKKFKLLKPDNKQQKNQQYFQNNMTTEGGQNLNDEETQLSSNVTNPLQRRAGVVGQVASGFFRRFNNQRDISPNTDQNNVGNNNLTTANDRKKSRHKSGSRKRIDIMQIVEFFDPIKNKKTLSKKTKSFKIKDKGSTQKHGVINKKVPADNSTRDEHGQITFYGNVEKQRYSDEFHPRWIVLRGFNLYWYRSALDKQQKGMITLPSISLGVTKKGKHKCFEVKKDIGASQGRSLIFNDNEQNQDFKAKIANMIFYKIYLESCQNKNQKLDTQIVQYFCDPNSVKLTFKDKYLNEEHKIMHLFEAMFYHQRLTHLNLVNCGISDDSLDLLLYKLRGYQNHIESLDLSQNDLTQHSVPSLCQYIKHENGWKLQSLILNRNTLYDAGLQLFAVGMFEKYQLLENHNFNSTSSKIKMPLRYLGLSDTKFSDNGFKYFLQRFEAIYLRNLSSSRDFEQFMDLDVSKNSLTETSMKYLADILKKFQGFKSLNISSLSKMKDIGFIELARALRENTSLLKLDISKNSISSHVIAELFHSISENYVLSELIVDIKGSSLPTAFSSNQLMSTYKAYISRESVYL
eukprot:403366908